MVWYSMPAELGSSRFRIAECAPADDALMFTFNVTGLPAGMTPSSEVTGSDVTIGGTPTVDFNGTVAVSGGDRFECPFSQNYGLVIAQPTISINDIAVGEGNSGLTPAIFTVSLSHPSAVPVSINWTTKDGTAKENVDYVQSGNNQLTIPALATSRPLTVQIKGDTPVEPNETFSVRLKKPVNASLGDSEGVLLVLAHADGEGL